MALGAVIGGSLAGWILGLALLLVGGQGIAGAAASGLLCGGAVSAGLILRSLLCDGRRRKARRPDAASGSGLR